MTITKTIGYAYPSSPIARAKGYNTSGCWYIAIYDESRPLSENDIAYAAFYKRDVMLMVPVVVSNHVKWGHYSMHNFDEV